MKVPVCEASRRIGILYGRKAVYTWSDKEGKVFLQLQKDGFFDDELAGLELIEQYYATERAKKDGKGIHRRDLYTFLNWIYGERDRAVQWAAKNPNKVRRKASNEAAPELWPKFLAEVYPTAIATDWRNTPGSIKAEFRLWEKEQP